MMALHTSLDNAFFLYTLDKIIKWIDMRRRSARRITELPC